MFSLDTIQNCYKSKTRTKNVHKKRSCNDVKNDRVPPKIQTIDNKKQTELKLILNFPKQSSKFFVRTELYIKLKKN